MSISLIMSDNEVESFEIRNEDFSIYDVQINGESVSFDTRSVVEFDRDSDVRVKLDITAEEILKIIEIEDLIKAVEEEGYKVIEEE